MEGWNTFSLIDEKAQTILVQIHFYIENNTALSPYKAPFGSVEFANSLSVEILFNFLQEAEKRLKKKGVQSIHIKDLPHRYRPEQAALLTVLLKDLSYKV